MNTTMEIMGWTLLHFVWQAALIDILFRVARKCLPRNAVHERYRLCLFALLAIAALPLITAFLFNAKPQLLINSYLAVGRIGNGATSDWLPAVVVLWLTGVFLKSASALGQWRTIGAVRAAAEPLPVTLTSVVERHLERVGLGRKVTTLISGHLSTPMTCGWLRPVILIPAGVLVCLDPRQLDAIIIHELMHIRRRDFLVNALQALIEALFFFHPSVHDISRQTRIDRELCCDQDVLNEGIAALPYSYALLRLEEYRNEICDRHEWRLAHSSQDGRLLDRISRIASPDLSCETVKRGLPRLVIAMGSITAIAATVAMLSLTMPRPTQLLLGQASLLIENESPERGAPALSAIVTTGVATKKPDPAAETPGPKTALSFNQIAAAMNPLPTALADDDPRRANEAIDSGLRSDIPEPHTAVPTSVKTRGPRLAELFSGPDSLQGGSVTHLSVPRYPSRARLRGLGDIVTVDIVVDETGRVSKVTAQSEHSRRAFSRSVSKALKDWEFEPLLVDGRLRRHTRREVFHFSLNSNWTPDGMCRISENVLWRCAGISEVKSDMFSI